MKSVCSALLLTHQKQTHIAKNRFCFLRSIFFLPPGAQIRMPQSNSRQLHQNSRCYNLPLPVTSIFFSTFGFFSKTVTSISGLFCFKATAKRHTRSTASYYGNGKSYIHLLLLNYTLPNVQLRHKALHSAVFSLFIAKAVINSNLNQYNYISRRRLLHPFSHKFFKDCEKNAKTIA